MTSVDVLYLGGTGRSGSTIVANALGGDPDAVSVGELRFLWQRGVLEDRLCGCGEPFSACAFWRAVMDQAYAGRVPDAGRVHDLLTGLTRLRQLPAFVSERSRARLGASPAGEQAAEVLQPLYAAIATVAGRRVVIDSSKLPTYALVLAGLPSVRVAVAHLVRDPRAAAFSWQRKKEQPDRRRPGYMEQRGVVKSALLWTTWNAALERGWSGRPGSYVRRRYESVVEAPALELAALGAPAGLDRLADRFVDEHTVRIEASHTVAGNPARHASGPTRLRLDDEWATAMPASEQRVVMALTAPLMRRYGYPTQVAHA